MTATTLLALRVRDGAWTGGARTGSLLSCEPPSRSRAAFLVWAPGSGPCVTAPSRSRPSFCPYRPHCRVFRHARPERDNKMPGLRDNTSITCLTVSAPARVFTSTSRSDLSFMKIIPGFIMPRRGQRVLCFSTCKYYANITNNANIILP